VTEKAGKQLRDTTVDDLRQKRRAKRKNPTGRRIRRDGWLAPLTLGRKASSGDPELNVEGVRASNKGFLGVSLNDYLRLLRWTAKQHDESAGRKLPPSLQGVVSRLGIDLSMWRDLVWNFQRYFGYSCCAGSPNGMSAFAESTGRSWVKGHRQVAKCFCG
jgi:hypothetical protein